MACSKPVKRDIEEEEKNCRLTYFFRDLLKKRLDFQIPKSETTDIISAVDTLVETIIAQVISSTPRLQSFSRLVKVGSMAEKTSIQFPDEFDYIVVSDQKDVHVERVCSWRDGYAHAKVTTSRLQSEWTPFLRGEYLRGSFTRDFFSFKKIAGFFQYLRSVGRKWLHRNPVVEETDDNIWCPYYDSLGNAFMTEVYRVLEENGKHFKCEKESGTLHVGRYVENHGPALMPRFIWIPKNREEKNEITVDITTAIGVQLSSRHPTVFEYNTFHPKIWKTLQKNGKYLLIPCPESTTCAAGLCFRLAFTETELELVRSLSKHHIECYRLLKYIFNSGGGISYIPSYALKTLVLKHSFVCKESGGNLATCFKTLVASLLYHIFNKSTVERIEPSRLLRLFLPGQKFRLNIPSIFIQGHNILDSKDYKIPCELFLMQIEIMLESLEEISCKDEPDEGDLRIVNSHRTAAAAYGFTVFPYPFLDKWNFGFSATCLEKYFRPYGVRK